jgi:biotin synthase
MKNMKIEEILNKEKLSKTELNKEEIGFLLGLEKQNEIELLRKSANEILLENIGNQVYLRGLIEFSNFCICDCYYCGIRKSNSQVQRFQLDTNEITECLNFCIENNFASVVLQSGERNDNEFINYVISIVRKIKDLTKNHNQNFGITLSIGEQTFENYQKLFEAGANRFLLRIETTNENLFKKLHPKTAIFEQRLESISQLQKIGFQVGTGVMIGLPEQTIEDLAADILFFKSQNIDMLGMGPYIPHKKTPLGKENFKNLLTAEKRLQLSLNMISVARIVLKNVNIASTTALETLDKNGRILGLQFGGNVVMPQFTPDLYKKNYILYDKKPTSNETNFDKIKKMELAFEQIERKIAWNESGDSLHYLEKN